MNSHEGPEHGTSSMEANSVREVWKWGALDSGTYRYLHSLTMMRLARFGRDENARAKPRFATSSSTSLTAQTGANPKYTYWLASGGLL